uniref:ShKT domain-containing protein n=1 Tax=Rhabditophanes sp. KR3021 TaxID=114890 RepID=A0AC35TL37_9BILA
MFHDPNWLPAQELCQITCTETVEICLSAMNSQRTAYRCRKLPSECSQQLRAHFRMSPLITPPQPSPSHKAFSQTPDQPYYNTGLQLPSLLSIHPPSETPQPPGYEPTEPAPKQVYQSNINTNDLSNTYDSEPSPIPSNGNNINYKIEDSDYPAPHPSNKVEYSRQSEVNNQQPIISKLLPESPQTYNYQPTAQIYGNRNLNIKSLPTKSNHKGTIKVTKLRKNILKHATQRTDKRVSFREKGFFDGLKDKYGRCCEWAINGLCDGHWQRVRAMCPKSCGKITCNPNSGQVECKRVINVNVYDCYTLNMYSYTGFTNAFSNKMPQQPIISPIYNAITPSPLYSPQPSVSSSSNNMQAAFLVENEMEQWKKFRKML